MNKITHLIILILLISCKNNNENPLEIKLNQIENKWSKKKKNQFKSLEKNKVMPFIIEQNDRDFEEWWYKLEKNKDLIDFFNSKGMYYGGDMTKVFYFSLHDKLNKKKMNIDYYIKLINNNNHEYDSINKYKQIKKFNLFRIGDSVVIKLPMDSIIFGKNNVGEYSRNFDEWNFNAKKDLAIMGIIKNKSQSKDSLKFEIKLEILKMSKKAKLYGEKINKRNIININLRSAILDSVDNAKFLFN